MNPDISIIIGYRNRESQRVKHALDSIASQNYSRFELIFIDYGSDDKHKNEIRELVESYYFARYYYNDTRGMPWNRSHALNTGIRIAGSDYVLLGDIDWAYGPDTLQAMADLAQDQTRVYCRNYLLPQEIPYTPTLFNNIPKGLPVTSENGSGAAHLISRKQLERIRGFDEYYCFWGVEDRDLYSRLDQLGIESKCLPIEKYPVFHQWHPEVSGARKGFFPDRWWENMNMHYQLKIDTPERNDENWGTLYAADERRVFHAREVDFKYHTGGDWFYRGKIAEYLVEKIQLLRPDECLKVVIPSRNKQYKGKAALANRLLSMLPGNYVLVKNVSQGFRPETDLIYMIWHLIRNEDRIGDYAIQEHERETIIKLMKK